MRLGTAQDLRSGYRLPNRGPIDKVIHRLDHHCADFLSKSPFFVLSTANAEGVCDGSPKGGPPGFVEVLDEERLAWADYSGNNRLDSFENLVTNDSIALRFLIPGLDESGSTAPRSWSPTPRSASASPSATSRLGSWSW